MKRVFRSILNVKLEGKPTIDQVDLKKNYDAFLRKKIEPEDPSYVMLYTWIEAHYRKYNELPAIELLFERAREEGNETLLATLAEIASQQPYIGSDYKAVLSEKYDEQAKDKFYQIVQKSWQIVTSGLKVNKKEIKGISSAVNYFVSETRRIKQGAMDVKTEGDIRSPEDGKEVMESYEKKKTHLLSTLGMFTNLSKIDDVVRGLKPGEIMIIAGFVGQAKTTITANFVYNGIMQGLNGAFVCMEMNYQEMRDLFYVLHCSDAQWFKHPKYHNLAGKISYEKVCYGELTATEQEFFEAVVKDFSTNPDYGRLFLYQPTEHFTPSSLEVLLCDYNSELVKQDRQLDFAAVDYIGLMQVDKNEKYGDFNVDLNLIVKRSKNFAINFDNGRGLRFISPFQCNRNGWKEAEKNDGVYKLSAISNANEVERSSDLVMAAFFSPEMQRNGVVRLSCLKHRKGALFPPFDAYIDFQTKHVRDFLQERTDKKGDEQLQEIPLN